MSLDESRHDREITAFLERHADELVIGTRTAEAMADALATRLGRRAGWVGSMMRLGWLVIILALLAAALPAIIIFGGRAELSAADLVARSQTASRNPPPFVMTLQVEGAEMRFSYDGAGSALIESLVAGPEGFGGWVILSDGTREGFYDPDEGSWFVEEQPRPVLGRLAVGWWSGLPIKAGATDLPLHPCPEPEQLADGVVADRTAHQIACGPLTFWLDAETLLVLRVDRDGEPFATATSIELAPEFAADTFSFDGSRFITGRAEPTSAPLGPGGSHTPWHGQLLDGDEVVIGGDLGRPQLVYAWADWCDQACFRPEVIESLLDMQRRYGERADVLAVAVCTQPDGARDAVEREGLAGLRIPVDAQCQALDLWGRSGVPLLLLYDAEGRLAQTWGPGEADAFPTREALEAALLVYLDAQP